MKKNRCITLILTVFFFFAILPVTAEEEGSKPDFGLGLGIGSQTFLDENGESVAYQELSLSPDFAIGKFGISLDLVLHYRFTSDTDNQIEIRREDWVPTGDIGFLDIYLPKFRYVRYGMKGDPLYVKLGSIDDATLGTGFIMGGYDNTLFRPEEPIFGMSLDLDGNLFSFPYVGIETFFGNLSSFDVAGTRVLGRPLAWSNIPILKNLEIGFVVAGDIAPYARTQYWSVAEATYPAADEPSITVWGFDLIQPILSANIASLAVFGAFATEGEASGGMIGFGGKLFSFLPYGFQLRFLGQNFLPAYFDATYDLTRGARYVIVNSDTEIVPATVGWLFSTGFSFFEDQFTFNATVDGPFSPIPEDDPIPDTASYTDYPHLAMSLNVAEGLLPGFYFSASYDKKFITSFADLIDPADAVIGAAINYQTGPAVITLEYDIKYDPSTATGFTTTAKLKTDISMF